MLLGYLDRVVCEKYYIRGSFYLSFLFYHKIRFSVGTEPRSSTQANLSCKDRVAFIFGLKDEEFRGNKRGLRTFKPDFLY